MKKLTDISEYNEIINKYHRKGVFSNDYLQNSASDLIINDLLYIDYYNQNAFLFVKKDFGIRMYYYINDLNEKADFSTYQNLVVEILFRGKLPEVEMEYLSRCGFCINLIRDQYAGIYRNLAEKVDFVPGVRVEKAKTLSDIMFACELFNETFDSLSGDFIPEKKYESLLHSGSVLIAWNSGRTYQLGALHQIKEGAINVIGHVAVKKDARGQGVGKALLDTFVEWNRNPDNPEKTRYQLWVQRQNETAVRMYRDKGFKYVNKSTVSLIKK